MTDYVARVGMSQQLAADTVDSVKLIDPYVKPNFATFTDSNDRWSTGAGNLHNLAVGDAIVFVTAGAGSPSTYAAGTVYYVVNVVNTTTFQLSATKGGSVLAGAGSNSSGAWRFYRVSEQWDGNFPRLDTLVIGNVNGSEVLHYTLDGTDPRQKVNTIPPGEFAYVPRNAGNPPRVRLWAPNNGTNGYLVAVVDLDIFNKPPFQWIQGSRDQTIPSGEYVPVHFDQINDAVGTTAVAHHDGYYSSRGYLAVGTTVAAGSNGESLNNLTGDVLNVASTAGFPTPSLTKPEYLVIYDASDSFKCQVVQYTGLTATSFTGIGTTAGNPTGSIAVATGDFVGVAHTRIMGWPVSFGSSSHYLNQSIGQVIWENEATTPTTLDTIRRLRYDVYTDLGVLNLPTFYWRADMPGFDAPTPGLIHQIVAQPGMPPTTYQPGQLVAYQNSGADLDIVGSQTGGADATMSTQCSFAEVLSPNAT